MTSKTQLMHLYTDTITNTTYLIYIKLIEQLCGYNLSTNKL